MHTAAPVWPLRALGRLADAVGPDGSVCACVCKCSWRSKDPDHKQAENMTKYCLMFLRVIWTGLGSHQHRVSAVDVAAAVCSDKMHSSVLCRAAVAHQRRRHQRPKSIFKKSTRRRVPPRQRQQGTRHVRSRLAVADNLANKRVTRYTSAH